MTAESASLRRSILARVDAGELTPAQAVSLLRPGGHSLALFRPQWELRPASAPVDSDPPGLMVVATDSRSLAAAPAGALRVALGATDALPGTTVHLADPTDTSAWAGLWADRRRTGRPPRRAVFLVDVAAEAAEHALDPVFAAVRAVIADRENGPVDLACVVTGPRREVVAASLGGFCQIAGFEDRRIRAVAVEAPDLPTGPAGAEAALRLGLTELAQARAGAAQVRHDRHGRAVRTVLPTTAPAANRPVFRRGGGYLISGGAGGIALRLAELLAERDGARFVLMGRSEPGERVRAACARIGELGGAAHYVRGDVGEAADVETAVRVALREFGALHGILHSAGINNDAYVVNKDPRDVLAVTRPKLAGARNLDLATAELPLDFLALFSSTAAYLCMAGQSDYAAANRGLGGFAAAREALVGEGRRSGRTVSVCWPLWSGGGMDLERSDQRVLEELQGMVPMPPAEGLAALEAAVRGEGAEWLAVYGNPSRAADFIASRMTDRTDGATRDHSSTDPGADDPVVEPAAGPTTNPDPSTSPRSDLAVAVEKWLLGLVSETVRLPAGRLRRDQEFSTIGVDSILIRKLTTVLEDELGPQPVTLFFEYRNVAELTAQLVRTHAEQLSRLLSSTPAAPAAQRAPTETRPPSGRAASQEPIAVIGLAGRYPGGEDLEEFWRSLSEGRDCVGEIPPDRWEHAEYHAPGARRPGMSYGDSGGFLRDVARFDAAYFNVSPREAERSDPKERLFLEVAASALQDAGYSRSLLHERTRDTRGRHSVGVFVGVTGSSYGLLGAEEWGRGNRVIAPAMDFSAANRLSYWLDAHGPSMVVDTACSASLTALHLACESLRSGESRVAVAGGVCINVHPSKWVVLSELRMLAPGGRCRAFGAGGDGFVPGEGVGAVVLKPLSAAVADGDPIRGVIRGTAVNHGGRTNGYTVPSPQAQGWVVADALRAAGVDARDVGYVEAHGTGTQLGDPIEVEGLRRAFGEYTDETGFCALGSVKSNIGHAESAAGIGGLTKILLQMEHRTIVPTLHCDDENHTLDLARTPFVLPRAARPWEQRGDRARLAALSSFGAGGANAHVVVEEYRPPVRQAGPSARPELIVLSARDEERLRTVAARLAEHLERNDAAALPLDSLAVTLQQGRDQLDTRLALVVRDVAEIAPALRGHLAGRAVSGLLTGRADLAAPAEEDPEQLVRLAQEGRLDELGRAFTAGADIPWQRVDRPGVRRIPLPTYPFAGGRHWIRTTAPEPEAETVTVRLEPAYPLIADHVVGGRRLVAGVLQLELARAAASLGGAGPSALTDVRWRVPLEVGDDGSDVRVVLRPAADGATYEISTGEDDARTVHSTGTIRGSRSDPAERLQLDVLRSRCAGTVSGEELYERAAAAGLAYGPAYRRVRRLLRGAGEALVELEPAPGTVAPGSIPAGLIDSALHAVQGILPEELAARTPVPASVAAVRLLGEPAAARYAYARLLRSDGTTARCDVVVADESGQPVLVLDDFTVAGRARPAGEPVTYLRPQWSAIEPARPADAERGRALVLSTADDFGLGARLAERSPGALVADLAGLDPATDLPRLLAEAGPAPDVYFLGGIDHVRYSHEDLDHLERSQERGAVALFHLARAFAAARPRGARLTVVTCGVQQPDPAVPADNPFAASLIGLTRSLARELPFLKAGLLDLDPAELAEGGGMEALLDAVTTAADEGTVAERALRGGVLLECGLAEAQLPPTDEDALPLRRGGSYLVLGGAGGLGSVIARHLAGRYGARLALVGRRPCDALPAGYLDGLREAGAEVLYESADVTDPEAMRRVVRAVRERFGSIDGVVHSAFVLADRTLERMDEPTFRAALDPKVRGTVVLEQVLADQDLDFVALFSSAISHTANPGQANYAAGSTFQDAFGRYLSARLRRRVRLFNWGFWGESGSVATAEYRARISASGVEPLSDEQGLDAFRRVLAAPVTQIAPIRLAAPPAGPARRLQEPAAPALAGAAAEGAAEGLGTGTAALPGRDYFDRVERLARQQIMDALRGPGGLRPKERIDLERLAERLSVVPGRRRLLAAAYAALVHGGHLTADGTVTALHQDASTLRADLAGTHPHSAGALELIADCAAALPDVLAGRRAGLELLFPGGSDRRVAPLYHDDPRSAFFNNACAGAVRAAVARVLDEEPGAAASVLEIGAGTGGTSRPVLQALAPYGSRLSYDYTDLATGLVRRAQQRLGAEHPFVRFRALDVSTDPQAQGFPAGGWDVVLAANVLHATPDLRQTLANCRRLLRPGGVLVLNEATRVLDSVNVVFGLTDGWWAYQDGELRLPHAPLLQPAAWRAVLAASGFRDVRAQGAPGVPDAESGQHILIAEHDGWTDVPTVGAAAVTVPAPPRPAPQRAREAPAVSSPSADALIRAVTWLTGAFAEALRIPAQELEAAAPLEVYGADSLITMEVADRAERELGADIGPLPFLGGTIGSVAEVLAAAGKFGDDGASAEPDASALDRQAEDGDQAPATRVPASAAAGQVVATAEPAVASGGAAFATGERSDARPRSPRSIRPPEPIAVVGLAGRYPGADTLDAFWENLRTGRRSIGEVPKDRWTPSQHHDAPGRPPHRWGGFLEGVDLFDPRLFRISPREAERMDPQERLFLQCVWEALEDSGSTAEGLRARAGAPGVGVFVGVSGSPYQQLSLERWGRGHREAPPSGAWSVANRVSHVYRFGGPSIAVDTVCSSSLTALHLACASLRGGECAAAVAGGVSLVLHPSHHLALSAATMLSSDGRGRAFSAAADGIVTGEGVGAVVLKPLAAALRDGDRVHGVLLASGINSNSSTGAYATPDRAAQHRLLSGVLDRAGLRPGDIQYVEAASAGSPLADPLEAMALGDLYGPEGGLYAGSVKPAIGHLEAASGMAQLTKVLLQLRHGRLAPTLDCDPPHPDIEGSGLRPVRVETPWPRPADGHRRAAVSAFGAGGANAHVVVEEAPPSRPREGRGLQRPQVVVVSAHREEQLRFAAQRLRDRLAAEGAGLPLPDVARTLQLGRTALPYRLAFVAADTAGAVAALTAHLEGRGTEHGVLTGRVRRAPRPPARPTDDPAALAAAWISGAPVDWTEQDRDQERRVVPLPHYPFAEERYWMSDTPAPTSLAGTVSAPAGTVSAPEPAGPLVPASSPIEPEVVPAAESVPVTAAATPDRVRAALVSGIGEVLGVSAHDVDFADHLSDYGFDSVSVLALAARLETDLGVPVSPTALYAAPDLAGLVDLIATSVPVPATPAPPAWTPASEPASAPLARTSVSEPAAAPAEPAAVAAVPRTGPEPVAIVGMAGAFPGSPDLEAFWANLIAGRDLVGTAPAGRPDEASPEGIGGFLSDIDHFDADFFRISPREARLMDPQHRLFLQTAWRAVEDAGHDPLGLAGSDTGVFVGVASSEYSQLLLSRGVPVDGQMATGNEHSMLANRLSFLLDLHGPSEPVDTACSSSLVAVHRAVRAIQDGDCSAALAGGVNLILNTNGFQAFGSSGMLAADGRCKSFDHRADGYARGEGVGTLFLKPLSRAEADGDAIHAVILGSAVNHGGRATSLTAPSPTAQAAVISSALRRAGVGADTIGYVEAHGTGTVLGDPIELQGLTRAFRHSGWDGSGRDCALGTVKTNVGHLETAAGVAGVIKTVLAMRHRMLPPLLHLDRPNPLLELERSPFHLVDSARPWDSRVVDGREVPRRAGVSSFGFGGANAHVVLEEYRGGSAGRGTPGPQLVVLSAVHQEQLTEYAIGLLAHVERDLFRGADADADLADLAWTLQTGRPELPCRLALVASSREELTAALRAVIEGSVPSDGTVALGRAEGGADLAALVGPDPARLLASGAEEGLRRIGSLWARGATMDWSALHGGGRRPARLHLPTYPFARQSYWLPETAVTTPSAVPPAPLPADEPVLEARPQPEPRASRAVDPAVAVRPAPARVEAPPPTPARVEAPPPTPARVEAPPPTQAPAPPSAPVLAPLAAAVAARPPAGTVEELGAIIAEGVGMTAGSLDLDRDFASYGIDSIAALRIMQRVQARFGEDVPMAAIFEYSTVRDLAAHLAADGHAADAPAAEREPAPDEQRTAPGTETPVQAPPPVPLEARVFELAPPADHESPPVFALYGDTGELSWLVNLLDGLTGAGAVLGVQAPGFGTQPPASTATMAELGQACAEAVLRERRFGPFRLAGYSTGALVAVEAARALAEQGHEVEQLTLVAPAVPGRPAGGDEADEVRAAAIDLGEAWGARERLDEEMLPAGSDVPTVAAGAARVLSALAEPPLPEGKLAPWLSAAGAWRGTLGRAAADYAPKPLAGADRTVILTVAETEPAEWHRLIVPPPVVREFPSGVSLLGDPSAADRLRDADPFTNAERDSQPEPNTADGYENTDEDEGAHLVSVNGGGERPATFWTHHLFGDVSYCVYLSRHLGPDYPVFAMEQVDYELSFRSFDDIQQMSAAYLAALRRRKPHGPYRIGGCSFGGVVAYEMTQQLLAAGEEVSHLYLVDPLMPGTGAWDGVDASGIEESEGENLALMLIGNSACQLWRVDEQIGVELLRGLTLDEQFDAMARHVVGNSPATLAHDHVLKLMRSKWDVLQLNGKLLDGYEAVPLPVAVDVTVFHAERGFSAPGNPFGMPAIPRTDGDTSNGLAGLVSSTCLTVHAMDADHFTIVLEENLQRIAGLLRPSLDQE
ncbi:SDR family NAD(P)-dependent oxidoreductase [Streptomyces sp. NL15-2K]|uniref:SDR family NAD(P)-dependent oxidoreductase n=1 Tax=Streptomyces sp. NL15-2K TaxID=376149 RepID=UPI000F569866|nr:MULTISPECIES: SDR family NAD(P)-dependent oxidoreductase [Actinomycetes]WKX13883.1 SDR family NAD(P)-dependent oxidoreductase [Kutzneria buriramensis]GCB52025.1 malonyl CoA-acyl carrier protein transacylase [Streptomyces sp. NL15-2K]